MIETEVVQLRTRVAKLERMVAFLMQHTGAQFIDSPRQDVPADVVMFVRAGDKLGAIKRYREHTGVDLAEAKRVVDTIE